MRTKEERIHNEETHWNKRLNNLKNVPEKLTDKKPAELNFSTLDDLKETEEGLKLKNNSNLKHKQSKIKEMTNKAENKRNRKLAKEELMDAEIDEELERYEAELLDTLEMFKNGRDEVKRVLLETNNQTTKNEMETRLSFINNKITEIKDTLENIHR